MLVKPHFFIFFSLSASETSDVFSQSATQIDLMRLHV